MCGGVRHPCPESDQCRTDAFEFTAAAGAAARHRGARRIRPVEDGSGCTFSGVGIEGTRLTISAPLSTLMSMAYGSRDYDCRVPGVIVGGPDWIMSEQHDVHVTVPDGQPANAVSSLLNRSAPAIQAALKTVLEDRFKLRVRIETRDVDAYALTSIGTLALTPVTAPQPGIRSGRTLTRRLDALGRPYGDFYGGSVSMADLTIWFKGIVGAPV
jgi:uncharacterized protein (TIGR03435 family)